MSGHDAVSASGRAVVLLSGGLDSATTLAIARAGGYESFALSVRYGQRNEVELEAARRVAERIGVSHHAFVHVDLAQFGGSALTGDIRVPKGSAADVAEGEIPVTYVPARNTVFLALALAWAETLAAEAIFIGVNAVDYSGYPDCRPDFLLAFQRLADLATRAGVERTGSISVRAPLLHLTKGEIIRRGLELGVEYADTVSCYDPTLGGVACGECAACRLRLAGFAEAGATDPARYLRTSGGGRLPEHLELS
jgi:7-cyano-7-deazaguanine synthase